MYRVETVIHQTPQKIETQALMLTKRTIPNQ